MNEFAAFADELGKLADVDDMRLKQPATYVKPISPAPPNPAFQVKAGASVLQGILDLGRRRKEREAKEKTGFAQSSFSGVMNLGAFPSASAIPPWKEPPLERVKTSGPPPDSAKLETTSEEAAPDGRAHLRKDAAASIATPQARLQTTQAVGGPKMSAPGPSIAQQSKPKGFGTALPGLAKMGFAMPNLSTMRTIAGGAMGAASGSIAGRALADEGEGGRGALKGALVGGALGAAGGHVLPRVQAGMASGMKPTQALRAVGDDVRARVHAASAPPRAAAALAGSGANPTAIGSANVASAYQNLSPHLRGALENSNLVKSGVPPEMAMQLAYMSRNKATGEGAIGSIARHAVGGGATPAAKSGPRLVSAGERNIPTNIATNVEANVPTNVEAMGKVGGVKVALIERLVRLGATSIPGTPKLLMDHRTPEQLGKLQNAVAQGWDKHVTKPLLGAAEPMLNKIPAGRMQNFARTGAKMVAEDPVGALLANAIPVPGAHPAYVSAKKGLERAIDRIAPVAHE